MTCPRAQIAGSASPTGKNNVEVCANRCDLVSGGRRIFRFGEFCEDSRVLGCQCVKAPRESSASYTTKCVRFDVWMSR